MGPASPISWHQNLKWCTIDGKLHVCHNLKPTACLSEMSQRILIRFPKCTICFMTGIRDVGVLCIRVAPFDHTPYNYFVQHAREVHGQRE